jgi:hypothetical protein
LGAGFIERSARIAPIAYCVRGSFRRELFMTSNPAPTLARHYSSLFASPPAADTSNPARWPTPRGYQWPSLYRSDVHTVAVPIFTNKSYYRGVEFT